MAVTVVKGRSALGTLGTLAAIGGQAFSVPWLSTLGLGMTGADAIMNGGNPNAEQTGALGQILNGIINGWQKITDNNIGKIAGTVSDAANKVVKQPTPEELVKKWGNAGGYNGWGNYARINPFTY